MKCQTLRWGFCGVGRICSDFVNALKFLPDNEHEVVAFAEEYKTKDQLKKFVENNKLPKNIIFFDSYDELFKCDDIDIIHIGVRNPDHKKMVFKALENGKNVLCEKPMALNSNEVLEMVKKAREKNVFLVEGLWSRCFPVYKQIRTEIEEKTLGEASFLIGEMGFIRKEDEEDLPNSRLFAKEGGGATLDIGVYLLSLALFVFRPHKPVKVVATGKKRLGVDDTVAVSIEFEGGKFANLSYAISTVFPSRISVCSSKGRLEIDETFWCPTKLRKFVANPDNTFKSISNTVDTYPLPEVAKDISFYYPNSVGLMYEAQHIRQCLLEGLKESPVMPLEESIELHKICDEIRKQMGVKYSVDKW